MSDFVAAGSNATGVRLDGMIQSGLNQAPSTAFDVPTAGASAQENWVIIGPVDQPSGNSTVAGNLTVFNQLNVEGQINVTGNLDIR